MEPTIIPQKIGKDGINLQKWLKAQSPLVKNPLKPGFKLKMKGDKNTQPRETSPIGKAMPTL